MSTTAKARDAHADKYAKAWLYLLRHMGGVE